VVVVAFLPCKEVAEVEKQVEAFHKLEEVKKGMEVEERRKSVKETFDGVTVTLQAMEVRTFTVRFAAQPKA